MGCGDLRKAWRMTNEKEIGQMKVAEIRGSSWARDMSVHYAETGAYRPQDISRLLGDPRDCVEIKKAAGTGTSSVATWWKR
jgi:hypothetical protein